MLPSKACIDYQELLVKPIERLNFISKFWFIAVITDLIITYLCYVSSSLIYFKSNFIITTIGGLIAGVIIGSGCGAISGIIQYILLRKYFIREWIIANIITNIFYSSFTIILLLWYIHFNNYPTTESSFFDIHPILLAIYNYFFFPFLNLISSIACGMIQWLVFQTYLKKANWWIGFPLINSYLMGLHNLPIAFLLWTLFRKSLTNTRQVFYYLLTIVGTSLVIYSPITREFLFNSGQPILVNFGAIVNYLETWLIYGNFYSGFGFWFSWITNILTFSTIQALAICCLRKHSKDSSLYLQADSLLMSTSDLCNFSQVRNIINRLERRINDTWQGELDSRFNLSYLIAVKTNDTIVDCQAINQVSQDNLEFTPLPQLVNNISSPTRIENHEATAKLQIVFGYPATFKIESLSGIPFQLLVITTLSTLLIITLILEPILLTILSQIT